MMKNIFSLLLIISGSQLFAQNVIFHENFDLPSGADSVSQGYLGSNSYTAWHTTTALSTSPTQSFHMQGVNTVDTVYFETDPFSTVGTPYVSLSFDHIAKLYPINQARIQISTDGGTSWSFLNSLQYTGADQVFNAAGWFNSTSHVNSTGTAAPWLPATPATAPDNSWWKREVFDLSGVASDLTSMTGYPDVRIRFLAIIRAAYNAPQTPKLFSAGWFVDDVTITASATCEVIPPRLNTEFPTFPCYVPIPTGFVMPQSTNSVPVGIEVNEVGTSTSGVDSVSVFYKINAGALTGLKMSFSPPSFECTTDIPGIVSGDTVEYYILATDNCGNDSREPQRGFHQFILTPGQPAICGTGDCGGLPDIINSFPWSEDFEGSGWVAGSGTGSSGTNHRGTVPIFPNGNWTLAPPSGPVGWSVRNGPSPGIYSGPSADHTSGSGKYVYTDFTQSSSTILARLMTPCIDLRDSVARTLSFYYHMYGSDIDRLWVGVDTGDASPAFWISYDVFFGPQQSSPSDPWKKAIVSLEPFQGKIIRLVFAANGSSADEDIAIDDLLIENASDDDVALSSITSPVSNTCAAGSNVPVNVVVQNHGYLVKNSIPVAYQLDAGTIVRDTLTGVNLSLTDTVSFVFSQTLNLDPSTAHHLKVWVELATDVDISNDTLEVNIPVSSNAVINAFPYIMDFENATTTSGNGNLNSMEWDLNLTSNGSGARWAVTAGMDNNSITRPLQGLGKNKTYLTFRDEISNTSDEAIFASNCIDLSVISSPQLSFQYYLAAGKNMEVLLKEGDAPWQQLALITGSTSAGRKFSVHNQSLASYAGKRIQIAFKVGGTSANNDYAAALDNIVIKEDSFNDLSIQGVTANLTHLEEGSANLPDITVDFGLSNTGNISATLGIELSDKCGGSQTYLTQASTNTSQWSSFITGKYASFPNLVFNSSLQAGRYDYKLWIHSAQDNIAANDTLYGETVVRPVALDVPYFQDFENCETDFATNGSNYQWEIATPDADKPTINSAFSGSKAAITNADANAVSDDPFEYLYAPGFSGLDTLAGVELRFRHKHYFGANSHGVIQVEKSGGWENLLDPSMLGLFTNLAATPEGPGFIGSINNWRYDAFPLDAVKNLSPLSLRFAAKVDNTPGWAIDDFTIHVPPQNSAAPEELIFTNGSVQLAGNVINLEITNSGAKSLNDVQLTFIADGITLFTEQVSFPSLKAGESQEISLQNKLNLSSGNTQLMVITSLPNNRNDAFPQDDTLHININLPETVDNLPYCNDFEASSDFITFDLKKNSIDNFWSWAVPDKANIDSAYSGTKAWVTGDSSAYPALVDKAIYTPVFNVQGSQCYKFSFWHNYDTEYNFDGGIVEVSIDSGKTWDAFGKYEDTTWYNTPYIQSLDFVKPGFSGKSGGWIQSWQIFKILDTGTAQFRFRFASNASNSGNGWAIDDVCFEAVPGSCKDVNLPEQVLSAGEFTIYPNPASDLLKIAFTSPEMNPGNATLSITDQSGKIIRTWKQQLQPMQDISIDVSNLPKGVYSIKTDMEGITKVKMFVKI